VPGIGQKTAERIVLELRDKVTPPAEAQAPPLAAQRDSELIGALLALGYSQAEAAAAAERVDGAALPLEDRVRAALEFFAG